MKLEGTWCTEDIDNEHLDLKGIFNHRKQTHFSNSVINATSGFSKGQRKLQRKNASYFSKNNFV